MGAVRVGVGAGQVGAWGVKEGVEGGSSAGEADAGMAGLLASRRQEGFAYESGPREGVASDGAHPITSLRDGVEPGRSDGTRDRRDRRVP